MVFIKILMEAEEVQGEDMGWCEFGDCEGVGRRRRFLKYMLVRDR